MMTFISTPSATSRPKHPSPRRAPHLQTRQDKTQIPARLCASPSDTIDNVKAKITWVPARLCGKPFVSEPRRQRQVNRICQLTVRLSFELLFTFSNYLPQDDPRWIPWGKPPHLRTPLTMSRPRSKTRIPACPARLCGNPSPSSTIDNFKAKIQDMDSRPSRCLCGKPFISGHHRQRQGQHPRHGFPSVSAASPHLRTPSTTSSQLDLSTNRYACHLNYCLHFLTIYYRTIQDGYSVASPSPLSTIDNVKAKIQD